MGSPRIIPTALLAGRPGRDGSDGLDGSNVLPTDEGIAQAIADPDSDTAAALSASIVAIGGDPLKHAKQALAEDPGSFKILFLPDSNRSPETAATEIGSSLYAAHAQPGGALAGVGASDYFTDGVGHGTTTFNSATANFTTNDEGLALHGEEIPAGTMIVTRNSATSVTLNHTIANSTGLRFWVGRHIIMGGNNGMQMQYWLDNPAFTSGYGQCNQADLARIAPDVVEIGGFWNDPRQGGLGETVADVTAAVIALADEAVAKVKELVPGVTIILSTAAPALTTDVGGVHFITDHLGNVNPDGLAQIYSDGLRLGFLALEGRYDRVAINDQAKIFGTRSLPTHPLWANQGHLSPRESGDLGALGGNGKLPLGGGYVATAGGIADLFRSGTDPFPIAVSSRFQAEFVLYSGPSDGTARLKSWDPSIPASQVAATLDDVMRVNGVEDVFDITNIDRVVGTDFLQITVSDSSFDFSEHTGAKVIVTGDHGGTTTERFQIYVDLPAVSANNWNLLDVNVPGVSPGNTGRAVGVHALPGGTFAGQYELRLPQPPQVVADDTVRIFVENITGSTVNLGGESWTFFLVR